MPSSTSFFITKVGSQQLKHESQPIIFNLNLSYRADYDSQNIAFDHKFQGALTLFPRNRLSQEQQINLLLKISHLASEINLSLSSAFDPNHLSGINLSVLISKTQQLIKEMSTVLGNAGKRWYQPRNGYMLMIASEANSEALPRLG